MALESGLYSYLSTNAGIIAQVETRVYPDVAPTTATLPYVTYTIISVVHDHHTTAAAGLAHALVQFDVWASTAQTRREVSEALREELDGLRQSTMGSVNVRAAWIQSERASYEEPGNATEVGYYRNIIEVRISYEETVPTF